MFHVMIIESTNTMGKAIYVSVNGGRIMFNETWLPILNKKQISED